MRQDAIAVALTQHEWAHLHHMFIRQPVKTASGWINKKELVKRSQASTGITGDKRENKGREARVTYDHTPESHPGELLLMSCCAPAVGLARSLLLLVADISAWYLAAVTTVTRVKVPCSRSHCLPIWSLRVGGLSLIRLWPVPWKVDDMKSWLSEWL